MMTKAELIWAVQGAVYPTLTQTVIESVVDATVEAIALELARGGELHLRGFGRLYAHSKPAGVGKNPRTGEDAPYPAKKIARFKAGKVLSDRINGR